MHMVRGDKFCGEHGAKTRTPQQAGAMHIEYRSAYMCIHIIQNVDCLPLLDCHARQFTKNFLLLCFLRRDFRVTVA